MENKRRSTQQNNLERQNRIQSFREHTLEKERIIILAKDFERSCNYECYDYVHQRCESAMEELQRLWKKVGSAGNEEERLWKSFCAIKDRFWKGIRLVKLNDRILDLCDELDNLRDDFDFTHKAYLIDLIDRKEDKIADLQWKADQIKEELGIWW